MEKTELSEYRKKVLLRIAELEKAREWDGEAEDNPETITLNPEDVDYLGKKLSSKIGTYFANKMAIRFYEKEIKDGFFVIKEIKGIENFLSVKDKGAVITCNHFSVYDNYAVFRAIRKHLPKGHNLYKVIREGNYTNFKGLYGYFFRHCNTLPLSSNTKTMVNFMQAVKELLSRGEKILIYPEQAMWWNYRKPRPLKSGAFRLAVKSGVPVLPAFITMEDTEKPDRDGYPVQAYTLHFLPPIYLKKELSEKENAEYLKTENYNAWKTVYESVYGVPLEYPDGKGEE